MPTTRQTQEDLCGERENKYFQVANKANAHQLKPSCSLAVRSGTNSHTRSKARVFTAKTKTRVRHRSCQPEADRTRRAKHATEPRTHATHACTGAQPQPYCRIVNTQKSGPTTTTTTPLHTYLWYNAAIKKRTAWCNDASVTARPIALPTGLLIASSMHVKKNDHHHHQVIK